MAGSSRWTVSVTWRPSIRGPGLPRHVLSRPLCDRGWEAREGRAGNGIGSLRRPPLKPEPRRRQGEPESIGASPAVAADISASAEAVNDDPGCPEDVCVLFIAFPPAVVGESYGLAGDDVYRVYLSDLADGGQSHLLMVSVEARDAADLEEFLPAAERIIASARIVEDSEG